MKKTKLINGLGMLTVFLTLLAFSTQTVNAQTSGTSKHKCDQTAKACCDMSNVKCVEGHKIDLKNCCKSGGTAKCCKKGKVKCDPKTCSASCKKLKCDKGHPLDPKTCKGKKE
ncbi:MAG: hypothetical protein ABII90_10475 [Bacteroidota bacterium]